MAVDFCTRELGQTFTRQGRGPDAQGSTNTDRYSRALREACDSGNDLQTLGHGDLRRHLQRNEQLLEKTAADCMTQNPKTISASELAIKALELMERHQVTSLVVVDSLRHGVGVLHIHDVLRAKVV